MNIGEVYTRNRNLRDFYLGMSYPYLYIKIGDRAWFLTDDKITERSYPYNPQQLSEWLFTGD